MRIGFDVDGVLASFHTAYQPLVVAHADGVDLFKPGDLNNPPCWNWPEFRGYTAENGYPDVIRSTWSDIKQNPTFWLNLQPLPDVTTLRTLITELERKHEVYFVTSRTGIRVKRQSEVWLFENLAYHFNVRGVWPTVLISSDKGAVAKALKLDVYVDDNYDNVNDAAVTSPGTRVYLVNRSYNQNNDVCVNAPNLNERVTRVATLGEMFDVEINNL